MEEHKAWIDPHQEDGVISPKEVRLRKAAKGVGLIAVWLGLPLTFLTCGGYIQSDLPPGFVYMMVSMVLRFLVLWLALHYPLAGGVLLLTDGVLSASFSRGLTPAGALGLLLIPSGILFILTWREHRKNVLSPQRQGPV